MITVDNFSFAGKKALVRVDFNVPLNDQFEITDTTRIDEALPTLRKILADGGSVILMSHLGRPKEGPEEKFSLKHIVPYLSRVLNTPVYFAGDCVGVPAEKASAALKPGEVLLLENLRFHKEETKGDEAFSEKLARLGDIYVNDAFGTAHRAHASTAIIANYFEGRKCFGYLMAGEIENISKVTDNPGRPFVAVLGGAKVSDKLAVIQNLLPKTDVLIIGGGMMFTFIKSKGGSIGSSLCEEEMVETCRNLLADAEAKGVKILLPVDTVINNAFADEGTISTVPSDQIPDGFMGLDIGTESVRLFKETLRNAKTILWNGPMGVFEMSSFENGTREVALGIAEATAAGAYSLVGGGDSVAAVGKYNLKGKVSYVSTGGGAMLEFIEGKELPGITAING
jgi:phosphoglycerate kinase